MLCENGYRYYFINSLDFRISKVNNFSYTWMRTKKFTAWKEIFFEEIIENIWANKYIKKIK